MEDYSIYFKVLGVKPGAKLEDIKVAYRDLINVWHPDRFSHNPRLQKKATEKLKEINIAFDKLTEFYERGGSFDGGRAQAPPKEEPKEKPRESPKESPKEPPPPPPPGKDNINEGKQKKSNFFKAILLIGAWFLGAYIWVQIKNSKRQPPASPPATVQNAPSTEPRTGIYSSEDLKRFSEETSKRQGANQPTEPRITISSLEELGKSSEETAKSGRDISKADKSTTIKGREKDSSDNSEPSQSKTTEELRQPNNTRFNQMMEIERQRNKGFFTIGSTKDEVLAVQGTATQFSDLTWQYGFSKVNFQKDLVSSWYSSTVNPLKVKMLPTIKNTQSKGFITIGSSKDEVLIVQGTPTQFSDLTWQYGFSKVHFQHNHVSGWYNSTVNPLKVKMLPNKNNIQSKGFFTIGSTKDEVLAVQGTPTQFSDLTWQYGFSKVNFQNDLVSTWYNSTVNPLKVKLMLSNPKQ